MDAPPGVSKGGSNRQCIVLHRIRSFSLNMPHSASTRPVRARYCQHQPSTGPVLANNGLFTGVQPLAGSDLNSTLNFNHHCVNDRLMDTPPCVNIKTTLRRHGAKPFSEPRLTKIRSAYMRHWGQ